MLRTPHRAQVSWWIVVACVAVCVAAAGPRAHAVTVRIRCTDAETGKITPVMACITGVDDGTVRLPPDGRVYTEDGSLTNVFYSGIDFNPDPDWIGPVRKMNGRGNNNNRGWPYELRPSIPHWKEPFAYWISGNVSVDLPPGRWRVTVEHGMEYVPVVDEFAVDADQPQERDLALRRWTNLPAAGWWSGDIHIHHPTLTDGQKEFLVHYAVAEDVHVANILEMGDHETVHFRQSGFGPASRTIRGDYAVVAGQEEPRSTFGHIIGLNQRSFVRKTKQYDLYDLVFQELQDQKAIVGYAHFAWNGCALPRGFPWYITTGQIDFVEILQFSQLNRLDYYDYLNLGFKLTAAAGSDTPWGSTIGEVRTYVHTGPKFDVDAWFDQFKKGHTFVSNGPVLEATVDDKLPGSEITKRKGETVVAVVRAKGQAIVGRPKKLTLAGSDGVLKEVEANKDAPADVLELRYEMPVERSQWLVASVVCDNHALALASPFYVIVDGRPFWHPVRGLSVVEKQLAGIKTIRDELAKGPDDERARAIRERLDRATKFYSDLLTRMAAEIAATAK